MEPTLEELRVRLKDYRPFLERVTATTNLASLFQMMNRQFRSAGRAREAGPESDTLIWCAAGTATDHHPGHRQPAIAHRPHRGSTPCSAEGMTPTGRYATFAEGRISPAFAPATDRRDAGPAIDRLRELVAETKLEVPGVNADITGGPVLELDEMNQSQRDSILATLLSLVLVGLIFVYGYHETGRPLKAMICLVVGLCYSMGYTTLTVGRLNILTITFAPMLVGMAIDFGVHLITRYEEELRQGLNPQLAMLKAMVNTGQGIYTEASTTAGRSSP